MASVDKESPGIAGLFMTENETPVPVELYVQGVIPDYICGALYRNGPGVFETVHADGEKTDRSHWFDGVGMLHRFDIDGPNNAVTYNSRVSAPGMLRAAASVPKRKYNPGITFGVQDPCKSMFAKLFSLFIHGVGPTKDPQTGAAPDNVCVTVENVAGLGIMARSDYSTMLKFDLQSLEIVEFTNWAAVELVSGAAKDELSGVMSTAHGQYDPDSKEYYNYVFNFGRDPGIYKIFCVGSTGKAEIIATFREYCSYAHSMALTDNYVIFILCPARVNSLRMLVEKSFARAVRFDKDAGTKFYVISRREKRLVAVYSTEAFFMFHTINSFEDVETGDVHIDLCRYESSDCINEFDVKNITSQPASFFSPAHATRYSLKGVSTTGAAGSARGGAAPELRAERRRLCGTPFELPRINERYSRKAYRYVYGPAAGRGGAAGEVGAAGGDRSPGIINSIVKVDLGPGAGCDGGGAEAQPARWWAADTSVGEAVFVPDPRAAGSREDDGALCFVAYNAAPARSALVVLDARTMAEVARAECATRVPAGFHGQYLGRVPGGEGRT